MEKKEERMKITGYDLVMGFFRRSSRDKISVYAAQAAFFIIISAVPFVMLLASMLQFVLPITESELTELVFVVIPETMKMPAATVIHELYTQTTVSLVSVTAVSILWSASKSVYALMQGLNSVYHVTETRKGYEIRIWALLNTILLIGIVIASLLLLVFGRQIHHLVTGLVPALERVTAYLMYFRSSLSLGMMVLVFSLMYSFLPNEKTNPWDQLPGAIFTTLMWLVYSYGYSYYINHFANYSFTYGSLAAIVLLMLWLYFCMNIFLIGGAINAWLLEKRKGNRGKK